MAGLWEAHNGTVTVLQGGNEGPGDRVMQGQSQDRILGVNQEEAESPLLLCWQLGVEKEHTGKS